MKKDVQRDPMAGAKDEAEAAVAIRIATIFMVMALLNMNIN